MTTIRTVIRGVGGYLPARVVTNDDLSADLDTSHQWIYERTGICQRHIADQSETTASLAVNAAQVALQTADLPAQEIDLIILATSTPDHTFPPSAAYVQQQLGAHKAVAFDINVACSGFLYALTIADQYIRHQMFQRALIIGAETLSRIVDWNDRRTAVLFGDGAGAMIVEGQAQAYRGILYSRLFSEGQGYQSLMVTGGPSTTQNAGVIIMNGAEVFRHAVQDLVKASQIVLQEGGYEAAEVDWVVPHQANRRIIEATTERLNLPWEKVIYTGAQHANTSAASIPLALWQAYEQGRICPGQLLLLQAFGAGYTWGASLVRA